MRNAFRLFWSHCVYNYAVDNINHFSSRVSHAARTVLMCIEKGDLPQGALIKIVKDGSFLVFTEKTPFEKVMDS